MKNKTRSMIIAAIIVISVAAMGYIWISFGKRPVANGAQTPEISKASTSNILLDGNIVADRSADLGFVVPAKITSITKSVGDEVKAGEILATEDNKDIKAQTVAAQANAQVAQAAVTQLQDSLKIQKLKLKGLDGNDKKIQKAQVTSAKDSLDSQQNVIAAAQANLENVKAQLAKTVLIAPFDGIITRQDAETGEISGPTTPAFLTVESKGPFKKIESFASDLDVAKIKVGDVAKVKFDTLNNGQEYLARIISIDPASTKNGLTTYKVTLELDQPISDVNSGIHASITIEK